MSKKNWLKYALLIGVIVVVVGGSLYFVFSPDFVGSTYELGKMVVKLFGLPESIG